MSKGTPGNITEVAYTHGYYREISPVFLDFTLLHRGVKFDLSRPLRYLELGFGQGLSLAIHAAAFPGEYWGTDFNPAHAANAKEMISAAGVDARILDLSFEELSKSESLPEFDIIALHGVWTWISEEDRRFIVELAKKRLVPGGILYVSYNCTPGWAAAVPLQHLLSFHSQLAWPQEPDISKRIEGALSFASRLAECGAQYFHVNPAMVKHLDGISKMDRRYLAHEYFVGHWEPQPFSSVFGAMSNARLEFAASGELLAVLEQMDEANWTAEGQAFLKDIAQPVLHESVRDWLLNRRFRRDIYIKGHRALSPLQRIERFRAMRFVLTTPADGVFPMIYQGPAGEITMQEAVYGPIIEILAGNGSIPKLAADIENHPSSKGKSIGPIIEAMAVLAGFGRARPAQSEEAAQVAAPACRRLNDFLCNRARDASGINFLASPVLGGGAFCDRHEQLFLLARQQGENDSESWASFAWGVLDSQGHKAVKDGKRLETPEENRAHLTTMAKSFAAQRLPVLKALGIA